MRTFRTGGESSMAFCRAIALPLGTGPRRQAAVSELVDLPLSRPLPSDGGVNSRPAASPSAMFRSDSDSDVDTLAKAFVLADAVRASD